MYLSTLDGELKHVATASALDAICFADTADTSIDIISDPLTCLIHSAGATEVKSLAPCLAGERFVRAPRSNCSTERSRGQKLWFANSFSADRPSATCLPSSGRHSSRMTSDALGFVRVWTLLLRPRSFFT